MPDDEMEFPPLILEEAKPRSSKPPVSDEEQIRLALELVRSHHVRIANTLSTVWGYRECGDYLQKLVFNGSDPADLKRVGFKPEVRSLGRKRPPSELGQCREGLAALVAYLSLPRRPRPTPSPSNG